MCATPSDSYWHILTYFFPLHFAKVLNSAWQIQCAANRVSGNILACWGDENCMPVWLWLLMAGRERQRDTQITIWAPATHRSSKKTDTSRWSVVSWYSPLENIRAKKRRILEAQGNLWVFRWKSRKKLTHWLPLALRNRQPWLRGGGSIDKATPPKQKDWEG